MLQRKTKNTARNKRVNAQNYTVCKQGIVPVWQVPLPTKKIMNDIDSGDTCVYNYHERQPEDLIYGNKVITGPMAAQVKREEREERETCCECLFIWLY